MATYEVSGPGGEVYQLEGPDDADPTQIIAQISGQAAKPDLKAQNPQEYDRSSPEFQAKYGPLAGSSGGFENFRAGFGKAFVDLGRGTKQIAIEATESLRGPNTSELITGQNETEKYRQYVAETRAADAPLMATGAGKAGNIAGNIAATVPALAVPGANTVAGAGLIGASLGALQPAESLKERAVSTAVGGTVGAVTQGIGNKVTQWAQNKIAQRAQGALTSQAQNVVRDAALKEARQAGYVVPPSTTNPTAANRIAESVAGKAATHQSAALKNQKITNRLVRQELGLTESAPLTKETLGALREEAGKVYKALKGAGRIAVDDEYIDDLASLSSSIDIVAKDFPEMDIGANKQVNALVDNLLKDSFDSKSAVELVKQLRNEASSNLSFAAAADPTKRALGLAQREAAGAVEDVLIRHLQNTGKGPLAQRFDEARTLIAKTYSVQSALNEGTGNVVASQLATQLKKGKPLSGNFVTIAKFAQAFPEAAREMKSSAGVSALDAITAVVGGSTLNPALFALPAARIGTREALLSSAGQAATATPKYLPSKTGTAALKAAAKANRIAIPSAAYAAQKD